MQTPKPSGPSPLRAETIDGAELLEADDDELVGLTLRDSYLLTRMVGEGGMARVYEAHHVRITAKRFAVKVLRNDWARDREVTQRFQREAQAIGSISHENVVDVFDIGSTPDARPYIVQEYLHGQDLASLIERRGRLAFELAVRIARQVCRGVQAAHDCGVVHRDLKPENIFLTGDSGVPLVKVLDFGLARLMQAPDGHVTRSGIVMGTPAYMSPEQARAEPADHRADVYGIGALLYTALTGRPPYSEENPQLTVLAVMKGEPPRPRALEASIPPALEAIVQRAMAREPAERYASAAELEAALARFENQLARARGALSPTLQADAAPPSWEARTTKHDRARLVAVGALTALMLALGLAVATLSGLELFVLRRPPTGLELALVALGIVGTVGPPSILALVRLRRRVWNNSPRVMELLARTERALVFGVGAYGAGVLAVRVHDAWRWQDAGPTERAIVAGWAGWNVILLSMGVLAAVAAVLHHRMVAREPGWARRFLGAPLITLTTVAGCAGLLYIGLVSRPAALPPVAVARAAPPVETAALPPRPEPVAPVASAAPPAEPAASVAASAPPPAEEKPDAAAPRASAAERDRARDKGLAGWLALAQRYPDDPRVLEPLAHAYGEKGATHAESVTTLAKLLEHESERATDSRIRALVVKLAVGGTAASSRALDLAAHSMGSAGPDLLYDLYVTSPAVRMDAKSRLKDPKVRQRFTPALAVAFDLRSAETCEARLEHLERAGREGDERSAAILLMLSSNTKKGCGWKKRRPCPPPCATQAAAFRATAAAIQERVGKSR